MGADFLLTSLPSCWLTPARVQHLQEMVSRYEWCDLEAEGLVYENGFASLSEARGWLQELITQLEDSWDNRDTIELDLGGAIYVCTGGLSWGDSPTDTYATFCSVSRLPRIEEQLLFWQRLDNADRELNPRNL